MTMPMDESPKLELQHIAVDLLRENEWNPNEMDEIAFGRLLSEIMEVGFIDPIQVVPMQDGTYRILGGAHRAKAAKTLGWTTIPCVVLSDAKWDDEDLQKFVTVRLNVLHGNMNPGKFASLYSEMADKYGKDSLQGLFAYTDRDGWDKLVSAISKGLKNALPPDIAKKFDDTKDEIKTVEGLSQTLNHLFTKYGNTLQYNFMVFAFGGKEHLYVAMNKKTKKAMDRVTQYSQEWSKDINEVLADVAEQWAEDADSREKAALDAGQSPDQVVGGSEEAPVVEEENPEDDDDDEYAAEENPGSEEPAE